MRLLLTGASGMLGKNILEHPDLTKYDVLHPTREELDLLDYESINNYLKKNKPQFILHCAGTVGGIKANQSNQLKFFYDNLLMGTNLVHSSFENNINNFLNVSSSCIYPAGYSRPLKEFQILSGKPEPTNEGYALAKISVLKMCEFISTKYPDFNYKSIIPCNLYGKYDTFDIEISHLIPSIILKIHTANIESNNKVEIWGDGSVKREFMYAADCADALLYFVNFINDIPQNINIGVKKDYKILDYYKMIANILGYKGKFIFNNEMPSGIIRKKNDLTYQKKFKWNPSTSITIGIKKTYEYFLNNHEIQKNKSF